jgi:hypothetical protein
MDLHLYYLQQYFSNRFELLLSSARYRPVPGPPQASRSGNNCMQFI